MKIILVGEINDRAQFITNLKGDLAAEGRTLASNDNSGIGANFYSENDFQIIEIRQNCIAPRSFFKGANAIIIASPSYKIAPFSPYIDRTNTNIYHVQGKRELDVIEGAIKDQSNYEMPVEPIMPPTPKHGPKVDHRPRTSTTTSQATTSTAVTSSTFTSIDPTSSATIERVVPTTSVGSLFGLFSNTGNTGNGMNEQQEKSPFNSIGIGNKDL